MGFAVVPFLSAIKDVDTHHCTNTTDSFHMHSAYIEYAYICITSAEPVAVTATAPGLIPVAFVRLQKLILVRLGVIGSDDLIVSLWVRFVLPGSVPA